VYRDAQGYTQTKRVVEMKGVPEFVDEGAQLGNLWYSGHFDVGDPLTNAGGATTTRRKPRSF
jgi:hypothetical protein